jgi:hypothetical protein
MKPNMQDMQEGAYPKKEEEECCWPVCRSQVKIRKRIDRLKN